MRNSVFAASLIFVATAAIAQSTGPQSPPDAGQSGSVSTQPVDVGRPSERDRGSLAGRGGSNPAGSDKTYSATIGSQIYSMIGSPMASKIGPQ